MDDTNERADGVLDEEQSEDFVDAPDVGDVSSSDVEELMAALELERERTKEEHNRYLRALADFSNYKKRAEERMASARQFASRELILKLLPVVDDFERALASSEETESYEALHGGLVMMLRKIDELLRAEGVQPIEAIGQQFDPMLHEAVMRVEDSDHEENTVVQELQKGYMQDTDVIRPSRVAVAVSND